ncbi:class I mannose-6-phosphate isomerase [Planctomicrobium sp. SH661]|uniref:class I mannose-6-phosphate isomerase n=1 Tax=Planctomicrobium sp. SH661 TaxID=3448124 RepID=UPI003F5BA742
MPDGSFFPGKTESWIVIDAAPGNRMYLGLKPGTTAKQFYHAIQNGGCEEYLNSYEAKRGDCIYLEAGTVHALGGGILVAEIQQPSDITYRLYDWKRTDAQGRPRELHIEKGIPQINFEIGPVSPVVPRNLPGRNGSELLVDCPHFVIKRHRGPELLNLPDDDAMHTFVVLNGTAKQREFELRRGQTAVIPAARAESTWELSSDAVLLDSYLPCR